MWGNQKARARLQRRRLWEAQGRDVQTMIGGYFHDMGSFEQERRSDSGGEGSDSAEI